MPNQVKTDAVMAAQPQSDRESCRQHHLKGEKMMRKVYREGQPYIHEEDHLAALEAEKKIWRCYSCGFETSDKSQAEAHFGEEEGEVSLCVEWANMDSSERVRAYQELTVELNETREENIALEAAMKKKNDQVRHLHTTNDTVKGANYTLKVEQSQLQAIIETQAEQIAALREALGALGTAADKVHKVMNVIQPFLKVFMEHGMLIADCMAQAALKQEEIDYPEDHQAVMTISTNTQDALKTKTEVKG